MISNFAPNATFTLADLGGGLGGFTHAALPIGGRTVLYIDWDAKVARTFGAAAGDHIEPNSIFITDIADKSSWPRAIGVDVVGCGIDCRPWSHAGNKKGYDDSNTLMYKHLLDFVDAVRPPKLLLECTTSFLKAGNCSFASYNVLV